MSDIKEVTVHITVKSGGGAVSHFLTRRERSERDNISRERGTKEEG